RGKHRPADRAACGLDALRIRRVVRIERAVLRRMTGGAPRAEREGVRRARVVLRAAILVDAVVAGRRRIPAARRAADLERARRGARGALARLDLLVGGVRRAARAPVGREARRARRVARAVRDRRAAARVGPEAARASLVGVARPAVADGVLALRLVLAVLLVALGEGVEEGLASSVAVRRVAGGDAVGRGVRAARV